MLEAQQILAVVVILERLGELVDLLSRDVAHAVGNLFEAGNLEALASLDGLNKGCGLQQGVVGAGVKPGVAAAHGLDVELVAREVGLVDVSNLEFTTGRWLYRLRDVDDVLIVEIETRHREIRLWLSWLFLEAHGLALLVELDDTVALGVADVVGKDRRAVRLRGRALHHDGEVGAVEDVVAQDERTALTRKELLADQERLRKAFRLRLHGVRNGDAPLRAIAEQPLEVRIVRWRRDHEDVPDARQHQSRQWIVDHRLVIDRHELLRHRDRQRIQPRARAASQDNSLTYHVDSPIAYCTLHKRPAILPREPFCSALFLVDEVQRRRDSFLERRRFHILIRQNHRLNRPLDADLRVVPADVAVALGRVVIVCLVLHLDIIRQRDEAMCKAARNEELLLILRRKLHADPLAELRRALADIDRYIKDRAARRAQELRLAHRIELIMQPAQRPLLSRVRLVILHKIYMDARLFHLALRPTLHEPPARIAEYLRLQHIDPLEFRFRCFHDTIPFQSKTH